MRISTRGRYGLAALSELAVRQTGSSPVSLRDIAVGQTLSASYLEQLFLALRRAGIVASVRGAQGGYYLARDPAAITVGEVLRVLEGTLEPVACVSAGEDGLAACLRDHDGGCLTRTVWVRLSQCVTRVLDSITIADLVSGGTAQPPCPECLPGAGTVARSPAPQLVSE
jgi:Rrf2 family cysteine metabolism transcriptional repressor